jgi:hypothetical protein
VRSSESRQTCRTTSGCAERDPRFITASNSVDRLMRLRAGSTAEKPGAAIRQLARGGLCGAGWRRRLDRPGCASATGSHARGLGAGYSAGRSACPWPRRSPRIRTLRPLAPVDCVCPRAARRWVLLLAGAVPGLVLGRSRIADFRATV